MSARLRVAILAGGRSSEHAISLASARSVLEALAIGRAVITTDAPGCRETVQDGVNGFLVTPRDVDSLVEAMERFILDPDLAATMGARSLALARSKYDVRRVNDQVIAALAEAQPGARNTYSSQPEPSTPMVRGS